MKVPDGSPFFLHLIIMKLILLFLYAIISVTYGQMFDGRFTVPVDHFRPQDGRTVQFVSVNRTKIRLIHFNDFDENKSATKSTWNISTKMVHWCFTWTMLEHLLLNGSKTVWWPIWQWNSMARYLRQICVISGKIDPHRKPQFMW